MAPKKESPDGLNLSRRGFLKWTGIVGIASAVMIYFYGRWILKLARQEKGT